jgi:hypothetical protein
MSNRIQKGLCGDVGPAPFGPELSEEGGMRIVCPGGGLLLVSPAVEMRFLGFGFQVSGRKYNGGLAGKN